MQNQNNFSEKISETMQENAALKQSMTELINEFNSFIQTAILFPTEISAEHYSVHDADVAIKKAKELL